MQKRKFWGWGYQDQVLSNEEDAAIENLIAAHFSLDEVPSLPIPLAEDINLPTPRVKIPQTLEKVLSKNHLERLNHTYGKSFPDLARAMLKQFPHPPDLVAFPNDQEDVVNLLDWADQNNIAVIPYGGGSSVCGGVETYVGDDYSGVISLDLRNLDQVLEIDKINPQIASSLLGGFKIYNKINKTNKNMMQKELKKIQLTENLSKNSTEIVNKILTS